MIRIRCITSHALPLSKNRIVQVEEVFAENFPQFADYACKIPDLIANPFKHRYQSVLITSETSVGRVTGFVLLRLPRKSHSMMCGIDLIFTACVK